MKRIISFALTFLMIFSMCICVNAITFSDLSSDHWAYESIRALTDEGTINGYEDGTFKPAKAVTRAEFVKMLGKWNQKYEGKYDDISESHWAYEYIMWSGLDAVNDLIKPDKEITRSEVVNLIWKRNGSPKHTLAPGAISNQGSNSDATSWAYTIGLVQGDDGLNLRLDSSLTRAEAATLIIRSRKIISENKSNNFIDVISEDILKATYESLNFLEDKYDANKRLTYGEIARMTMVFGFDGKNISFVGNDLLNSKDRLFEPIGHKFEKEFFVLASNVWGDNYYNLNKIDQPVTKQDAISAIMYGFTRRGLTPVTAGEKDAFYPDCKDVNSTDWENIYLSYANKNGIKLKASNNLGAEETLTVKEYSGLLVLFNEAIGLGIAYRNGEKQPARVNTSCFDLPGNFMDFTHTIDGVPAGVYALKNEGISARDAYKSANVIASAYCGYLSELVNYVNKTTGISMDYTYYPALSYKQNRKVVFVAKFNTSNSANLDKISADKLFEKALKSPLGFDIDVSKEIYVVFETNGPLLDISLSLGDAYIKSVFTK